MASTRRTPSQDGRRGGKANVPASICSSRTNIWPSCELIKFCQCKYVWNGRGWKEGNRAHNTLAGTG